MFTTLFSVAVAASFAIGSVLADDFTIATPSNFTQCESVPITWNGGNAPYNLAIVSAEDQCGPIVADLGDHDVNHIHYTVDLQAGKQVILSILDTNDNEAWSGTIPVVAGGNTSCLPANLIENEKSSSVVSASSASSFSTTPTTLVVPPAPVAPEAAPSSSSSAGPATPQGASGSGLLSSGATTVFSASIVTLLAAFAATIFTITL